MALAKLPRPGDREMLLALIIGAAAVVAIICSFAMFPQYMREDADDDGNSNAPPANRRAQAEDVHDHGRPQGRISNASRLDVAVDVALPAQEHDAMAGWIRFVPLEFVVWDLDLGADADMRPTPRLIWPIVGDDGVSLAIAHMDLIGPIGVGLAAAG